MGAEYLLKPISPVPALVVAEARGERAQRHLQRHAPITRKPVTRQLKAWVQDLPVRILDISYGGLRLEMERTPKERLPRSLSMTLPTSNVAIDVNVVWQKPSGESGWLCGAAIPDTSQTTWRQLVDAVSSEERGGTTARLAKRAYRACGAKGSCAGGGLNQSVAEDPNQGENIPVAIGSSLIPDRRQPRAGHAPCRPSANPATSGVLPVARGVRPADSGPEASRRTQG